MANATRNAIGRLDYLCFVVFVVFRSSNELNPQSSPRTAKAPHDAPLSALQRPVVL